MKAGNRILGVPAITSPMLPYPGETVTIDGKSITLPAYEAGLFVVEDISYIKVSGLRIVTAGPNDNNDGIYVDNSHHIIIEDNYTYNMRLQIMISRGTPGPEMAMRMAWLHMILEPTSMGMLLSQIPFICPSYSPLISDPHSAPAKAVEFRVEQVGSSDF